METEKRWPDSGIEAENEDQDSEEDFYKVADLVPDLHFVNTILKVCEIESIVLQEPNIGLPESLSAFASEDMPVHASLTAQMNLGQKKANTLKSLMESHGASRTGKL